MRTITIHLRDFVDETKRRERRGGGVIVAVAALAIAAIVARPAEQKKAPPPPPPPPIMSTATVIPEALSPPAPAPPSAPALPPAPAPTLLPARAEAAPQSLHFEPLTAGGSSAAQMFTVHNAGEQPLTIRKVAANGEAFRVTNGCGAALERGVSCSVAVVFAPVRAGEHGGSVTIATSAKNLVIPLRGAARPVPPVELAPLDFGRRQIGEKVAPGRVRFVNSGAAPVVIADVALAPAEPFSIAANRCEAAVPPGGECDVLVGFVPRDGQSQGEVKMAGADGHVVAHAAVSGAGFESHPPVHLDIKPRELHFLSGVTPPQRITITNPSAEAIKIYSVRVVGGGRSFKVSADKCEGTTLQPRGGSCQIVVGATAGVPGGTSMQILVDHSGASQPDTIGASTGAGTQR